MQSKNENWPYEMIRPSLFVYKWNFIMSIISIYYFALIALAVLAFYIVPKKIQWIVLLLTSLAFFYFAGTPWTFVYVLAGIIVTWLASFRFKKIRDNEKLDDKQKLVRSRIWLIATLVIDVGMLAALKYMNFLLGNASAIFNIFVKNDVSWSVNWPAALGISFYTLQIVGYLLDCYWGVVEPQKNIGKFALFTCFFPQMVSGPISRYGQLGEELYKPHKFKVNNIVSGLVRISSGLFKKVVLAEGVAQLTSMFMGQNTAYSGAFAILGLLTYVIRIYADFSGCMDIVIGSAKLFDVEMVENFKSPFTSRSIQEFWQKWHITLGLWLRDYIMYPLLRTKAWAKMSKGMKKKCGKRVAKLVPTHIAMLVLWFFMGLWHGGGWNFILEGVWFWLVIVAGEWCAPLFKKGFEKIKFNTENSYWVLFQRARTLLIYAIGALMFKSASVGEFFDEFARIFSVGDTYVLIALFLGYCLLGGLMETFLKSEGKPYLFTKIILKVIDFILLGMTMFHILVAFGKDTIALVLIVEFAFAVFGVLTLIECKNGTLSNRLEKRPIFYRVLIAVILIYLTIVFGFFGEGYNAAEFIYGEF